MDFKPLVITVFAAFIGAVGQIEIKKRFLSNVT